MKQGLTALVLAGAFLAAGDALADEMTGNTQFFIGQTYLADFWKPLDEPASFGVEVDFAPSQSPVHVALGMNVGGDTKHVSVPYFGKTGHVGAGFLEFSAGFLWHPVKRAVVRPYLGAGVLRMFAGVGTGSDFWSGSDTDSSFGFYGNAGIFFKVGDYFNIGLDGRIVRGTSITLAGVDGNVNYGQASLLLGFSWGKIPGQPQNGSTPTNEPADRM
jgi:hypothetical protein